MAVSHSYTNNYRLFRKIGTFVYGALVWAIIIGLVVLTRSLTVLAFFVALGLAVTLQFIWSFLHYAEEVALSGDGLEARTLSGHSVRLRWPEIVSAEEIPGSSRGRRLRLTGAPGQRRIVLTEPLSDFDRLQEAIQERAERATWTRRSHFWSYLLHGE